MIENSGRVATLSKLVEISVESIKNGAHAERDSLFCACVLALRTAGNESPRRGTGHVW
jgi:hypothetical protein